MLPFGLLPNFFRFGLIFFFFKFLAFTHMLICLIYLMDEKEDIKMC